MLKLRELNFDNQLFTNAKIVGTLLFAEFPSTIILADGGIPLIKEWVDCSDDNSTDIYFYYYSTKENLKMFLDGQLTHYDFCRESLNGLLYFQEIRESEVVKQYLTTITDIEDSYKPINEKIQDYNWVEKDKIYEFFSLNDVNTEIDLLEKVKELSLQYNSETLNVHLHTGNGVSKGIIDIAILANLLSHFDKLYKHIALDKLKSINRGVTNFNKMGKKTLEEISTETYYNIAASYSILIRPKKVDRTQTKILNENNKEDSIVQQIFNLLNNSLDQTTLKSEYLTHSPQSISHFESFISNIQKLDIELDLFWFNPFSTRENKTNITLENATRILSNINELTVYKEEIMTRFGHFSAVDITKRTFKFKSNNQDEYSGHFSSDLDTKLNEITFTQSYEIHIERKILKEIGKVKATITDYITRLRIDN